MMKEIQKEKNTLTFTKKITENRKLKCVKDWSTAKGVPEEKETVSFLFFRDGAQERGSAESLTAWPARPYLLLF